MDIVWRSISKGSKNGFYLVKCESEYNGKTKPTWFSLPSLRKLDKDNVPVNPTWYDLGNDEARLAMLAKIGQIEGLHKVDIKVYVLDETGKRKQTQLLNEDGSPQIVNGKEVWEDQTRDAHPVTITPCDDVAEEEPAAEDATTE